MNNFQENSIVSQETKDNMLIDASRKRDVNAMKMALMMGANPNCKVAVRVNQKEVLINLIDYCNNFKGKKGDDVIDLLTSFDAVHEKKYPQKKFPVRRKVKGSHRKDYKIRMRQKKREEWIISRLTSRDEFERN